MAGFIKSYFARRRSRKHLRAWTSGWVWAMTHLQNGKSWHQVRAGLADMRWIDMAGGLYKDVWFIGGAETAIDDYKSAALSPCDCAPLPEGQLVAKGVLFPGNKETEVPFEIRVIDLP